MHRGRWFLWDHGGTSGTSSRNRSRGEEDGLEFAFSHGGFCAAEGVSYPGEEAASTQHVSAILPLPPGVTSAGTGEGGAAERYPLDVFWGELMQHDAPPTGSPVEWRNGSVLLVKEPLTCAHGLRASPMLS